MSFQRNNKHSKEKEDYLNDAFKSLIQDAVTFESREDFDEYIVSVERQYFKKTKLPTSPYKSPHTGRTCVAPQWPPRPTSNFDSNECEDPQTAYMESASQLHY